MNNLIKERLEKIQEGIVPEGYKKTKVGIIPGEWEVRKLGDISEKISDGIHGTPKYDENGKYSFINGNNLDNGKITINQDTKKINDEQFKKIEKELNNQTIFISLNGTIGNMAFYNNEKVALGKSVGYINLKNRINKNFIYFKLSTNNTSRYFLRMLTGSTIKNLSLKTLKNTKILYPPLGEQEKIVDILSTWDKAIENIEKLIKEKEIQKKGLLQQLLTGETRLPGFTGKWEEVILGEVGRFFNGRNLAKKDIEDKGSYNCILYGELFTLYSEIIYNIENKTNNMEQNSVIGMSNDLLFPTSTTVDALSLITPSSLKVDNVILGGDIMVYRGDKNIIDSNYLSYYFNSSGKIQLARFAQGITIIHIYSSEVKDFKIKLPPLPEQNVIAEILSTADKEIELLNQLLENKKEEKKGLMQLLLTGIVRV